MKIINNVLLKVHRRDIKDGVLEIPVRVQLIKCRLYKLKKLEQINFLEKLALIIIPSTVKVVEMGIGSCNALQELCIPDSVQYLDLTVDRCASLEKIIFPSTVKAVKMEINSCNALQELCMPDSVQHLGLTVIRCASLEKIKLPQSLVSADEICIFENPNLKSVILPKSLQTINELLVACCENIQTFVIPESCSIDTIYVNDNPKIDRRVNEDGEDYYNFFAKQLRDKKYAADSMIRCWC